MYAIRSYYGWLRDVDWQNYEIILEGRPIDERIDSVRLHNILSTAIAQSEITLDYKYAIKNSTLGKEKILFGDRDYNPRHKEEFYQLLFQNDFEGSEPNYLYVYFPERNAFLLKQTGLTIIPTIILTGLLIAIFGYALLA